MSTMNLTGLASGVDTDAIVEKLIALERAPQQALKLRASAADARHQALADVQSRLRALQTAAQALRSPALWLPAQTVAASDPTRVTATASAGGAAPGGYQVVVSALASSAQRTYAYTPPAADDSISVGGGTIAIPAGSTLAQAVDAINHSSGSPVYAVAAGGQLVLASRATGAASDASASSDLLVEDTMKAVSGRDAQYSVNGASGSSPANTVTGAIPGVQLVLAATTSADGVSVNVSTPATDPDAVRAAVKSLVGAYNDAVSFLNTKLGERHAAQPPTSAEAGRGALYADTALRGLLGRMRVALSESYAPDNPAGLRQASAIGLSTGAAVGGNTLNSGSIAGKITIDEKKLDAALSSDPNSVRALLGGSDGLAQALNAAVDAQVRAGGTLDAGMAAAESTRRALTKQVSDMDRRLSQRQQLLKKQFAAMEQALQAGHAQSQWLAGQLTRMQQR